MKFYKNYFSYSGLILSFILLIYTFYRSEIHWNGQRSEFYFTYYIISIISLIIFFISFFLSQIIRSYLKIFFISILMTFYTFEIYLNIKKKDNRINETRIKKYLKNTNKIYDIRTKEQIYKDLVQIDNKVKLAISPTQFVNSKNNIFQLSGISNSRTILCNENGYYSEYQSDKYGFNNPNNVWNVEQIEYVIIGDSYAQGSCVNRPNDIASILRKLSKKEVINLGYGGNGPLIEYATLREYMPNNVKKIIWLYYEGNDLKDLSFELNNSVLQKYLTDLDFSQNLKEKQRFIDEKLNIHLNEYIKGQEKNDKKYSLINILKLSKFRGELSYLLPKKHQPNETRPYEDFKEILKISKLLALKNQSELYFIYIPEFNRYKANYSNDHYNKIIEIITSLEIPIINIHEELIAKENDPFNFFPFREYGHFNVYGYQKIASYIFNKTQ